MMNPLYLTCCFFSNKCCQNAMKIDIWDLTASISSKKCSSSITTNAGKLLWERCLARFNSWYFNLKRKSAMLQELVFMTFSSWYISKINLKQLYLWKNNLWRTYGKLLKVCWSIKKMNSIYWMRRRIMTNLQSKFGSFSIFSFNLTSLESKKLCYGWANIVVPIIVIHGI